MGERLGFSQVAGWSAETGRLVHITPYLNQSEMTPLSPLKVRSGVLPSKDISTSGFAVKTKASGADMSVDVYPGLAIIQGTQNDQQGAYSVWSDTKVNRTVTAADSVNSRIDLVVLRVQDSQYLGSTDAFTIEVITGTPSASPVIPTAPANSLTIALLTIAPGATTLTSGVNILDCRQYTAARGGDLYVGDVVTDTTGLMGDNTPTNPEPYQMILKKNPTNDQKQVWVPSKSAWQVMGLPYRTLSGSYSPVLSGTSFSMGNATASGRWWLIDTDLVGFAAEVVWGSTTSAGSGNYSMSLPFTSSNNTIITRQNHFHGYVRDVSPNRAWILTGICGKNSGSVAMYYTNSVFTVQNQVGAAAPIATPATGDVFEISGIYRVDTATLAGLY